MKWSRDTNRAVYLGKLSDLGYNYERAVGGLLEEFNKELRDTINDLRWERLHSCDGDVKK